MIPSNLGPPGWRADARVCQPSPGREPECCVPIVSSSAFSFLSLTTHHFVQPEEGLAGVDKGPSTDPAPHQLYDLRQVASPL